MTRPRPSPGGLPVIVLCALLLFSSGAGAGSGGSVYSRFGIGDLSLTSTTGLFALGGTGLAVMPVASVNDLNPAAWAGIGNIRFSAGALYEGFSTSDGTSSLYLAGTRFNGFSFAIPIAPSEGITLAAGLVPYSRINYLVVAPETRAGLDYMMTYRGEGGITRAFTGLSITLAPGLHAGARLEYLFGTLRYSMKQEFTSSTYAGAGLVRSENTRGFGSTIGVLYEQLGTLLRLPEDRSLSIGVSFSPTTYPTDETERIYEYDADPASTPPDSSIDGESTFRLPLSFAGGVSYRSPKLLLAMDARYQEWGATTFGTFPDVRLRNSVRISAGVELYRDVDPNPATSRKTTYAFGLFHEGGYLEVRNTSISENGVTAGISFPILNETRLSFAASFSMRGTNDNLLQEDKIFRLSASMDISELWFQRTVEE
jgi:hypothetical protein